VVKLQAADVMGIKLYTSMFLYINLETVLIDGPAWNDVQISGSVRSAPLITDELLIIYDKECSTQTRDFAKLVKFYWKILSTLCHSK
jgi:hypothetical protein